jgi:hypothetical protein
MDIIKNSTVAGKVTKSISLMIPILKLKFFNINAIYVSFFIKIQYNITIQDTNDDNTVFLWLF